MRPSSGIRASTINLDPVRDSAGLTSTGKAETLQDKMLLDDESVKQRRNESRREWTSRLPELPNEAAIRGELKDEEELLHLYEEIEAKKTAAINKRRDIAYRKIEKLEQEKKDRMSRLE